MAHRTQLYLEDTQFLFLRDLARREKKSIAQVIREWIEEKRTRRVVRHYTKDPLFQGRGLFTSGDPDLAAHVDEVLYGDDE